MKICKLCKEEKPFTDFHKQQRTLDGAQAYCKLCKSKKAKLDYLENKAHHLSVRKSYRELLQNWYLKLKQDLVCAKCGDTRWYILDFHHRDPKTKKDVVSKILYRGLTTVVQEIKKCVALCANCHREFHYRQKRENLTLTNYLKRK